MKRAAFVLQGGIILVFLAGALIRWLAPNPVHSAPAQTAHETPELGQMSVWPPGSRSPGLPFIENRGQVDGEVAFYATEGERTVSVTRTGRIVHALAATGEPARPERGWSIHEELVGGRPVTARGRWSAATTVNYLTAGPAGDAENGATRGVPTWRSVELAGAYPGIDVELVAQGNGVEKLFHIAPGGRVEEIRVRVAGAQGLRVTEDGRLELATGIGALHFTRPVAYQEIGGERRAVEVAYEVAGQKYGFRVGRYDQALPLTIDPLLASTYLGGAAQDGEGMIPLVREPDGDLLVAAATYSSLFPTTPGAFDQAQNGQWDIVIARLDSSLTTLKTATFLGGNGDDGRRWSLCLALGLDGSVYVAGPTNSAGFPTTAGAFDRSHNGGDDVMVARLTSDLDTLLASTYLGTALTEWPTSLVVGAEGEIYVGGTTTSPGFPTTAGAYDRAHGGDYDAFAARFDPLLTTLVASTYLGGGDMDHIQRMCLDDAGNLYLTGATLSANFPVTSGAFDRARTATGFSGFVARMSGDLATLLASTYFDGSTDDFPYGMALGMTGDVFISGHTASSDMPTTAGAYDRTYNSAPGPDLSDAYIARFSPDLTTLVAATFLGGASYENAQSVLCDGRGHVVALGRTAAADFPVTDFAFSTTLRGTDDVFISKLDEGLTRLEASTFLGGNDFDSVGGALVVDPAGNMYVAGRTFSADFPTTEGAYDRAYNGSGDLFVSRLDGDLRRGSVWPTDVEPPEPSGAGGLSLLAEPNPCNPRTTLRFFLPQGGPVRIAIYDLAGRQVRMLIDGALPPGSHQVVWNGQDDEGRGLPSGGYLACMTAGKAARTTRLCLVR